MDDQTDLRDLAEKAFNRLLTNASGVLIAVSGGPDSMALLSLLVNWRIGTAPKLPLAAATVDHGLRTASADEAAGVAAYCSIIGVPHAILRWTGAKPATHLQEQARRARYHLLIAHARDLGLSHVALAHHGDDQAETVLLRLCGGSGIGGLAAMRESTHRDGKTLTRPLLGVSKAALVAYCQANILPFVDDPSNEDERFGRARLRRIMPMLVREGLTTERLSRLATRAARADAALEQVSEVALAGAHVKQSGCVLRIDWRRVAEEPEEIRLRVLMKALSRALDRSSAAGMSGPQLEGCERLLAAVDDAYHAGARLRRTLAGRMITLLSGGVLTVTSAPPRASAVTRSDCLDDAL